MVLLCHQLTDVRAGDRHERMGDPMELALLELALKSGLFESRYRTLDRFLFDRERRRGSVLCLTRDGPRIYCKGASESVLPLCETVLNVDRLETPLTEEEKRKIEYEVESMAHEGMRVLAFAFRPACDLTESKHLWEKNLVFLGLAAIQDSPRPEAPEALKKCSAWL